MGLWCYNVTCKNQSAIKGIKMKENSRREFIFKSGAFIGSAAAAGMYGSKSNAMGKDSGFEVAFRKAEMKSDDEVNISADYKYSLVVSTEDEVGPNLIMGENCDFTAFQPGENKDHGFLWVNNEALHQNIVWGKSIKSSEKTKKQIEFEKSQVGGTYIEIRRKNGKWETVKNSRKSFKISGQTQIPMAGPSKKRIIEGTLGNCGGGFTPWGSILTCEENFQDFYFKPNLDEGLGWNKYGEKSEVDYGWVVEILPNSKSARKLSALGRFPHEGATVFAEKGEKVAVYMGEDRRGGALFKFLSEGVFTGNPSKDKDLLVNGTLYAANLYHGRWEEMTPKHPAIQNNKTYKKKYSTVASIVEDATEVAKIVGATPLNRAEDIEVDPKTGDVMIALTNNHLAGDLYGQILKVSEKGKHGRSMEFTHEPFIVGGPSSGFSCPDNICYGPDGTMYFATDVSGYELGVGAQKMFKKNGLFKVEFDQKGHPIAIPLLYSPFEAEVTGPCFSSDGTTLFVSIQHPGEMSFKSKDDYTSNWPSGKGRPKSSVIAVERV